MARGRKSAICHEMTEPSIAAAPEGAERHCVADMTEPNRPAPPRHIVLTSHPRAGRAKPPKVSWGAASAAARGPIIGTLSDPSKRNVIGAHAGSYALYRALAIAAGSLNALHRPDLSNTAPAEPIGPHPQWADPAKIVSLDPWGHVVGEAFAAAARRGLGHPPDDRRDQGAPHRARAQARDAARQGRARRPGRDRVRRGQLHQDRDRAGLVSARHRRALRRHRRAACAAICSSRPAACSPSW